MRLPSSGAAAERLWAGLRAAVEAAYRPSAASARAGASGSRAMPRTHTITRDMLRPLRAQGEGLEALPALWAEVVEHSAKLASPWAMGHMDTAPHPAAALTDSVVSALNNNLLFREISPLASVPGWAAALRPSARARAQSVHTTRRGARRAARAAGARHTSARVREPARHGVARGWPAAALAKWPPTRAPRVVATCPQVVEEELILEFSTQLGLPAAASTQGVFTSGGSLANLTALFAAAGGYSATAPGREHVTVFMGDRGASAAARPAPSRHGAPAAGCSGPPRAWWCRPGRERGARAALPPVTTQKRLAF